jgi:glycine hydroxymethyltransferase
MLDSQLQTLKAQDPTLFDFIQLEGKRQDEGLELIASENYASRAVMEAQGSLATNKYAEGLPKKRYYGGCEFVDKIEELAIERVTKLFNCKFANVQPHSGSQANMASYFALIEPGDVVMGMDLAQGGHLTHGSPVNFSGRFYKIVSYGLNPETQTIDYEAVEALAIEHKPKLIIAGASAYPRVIDFARFRAIADKVGAFLLVDMAHIAGLVAAGVHPSPFPHAHVVTSTTHKTLRGPRGGIILTNDEELFKKINFNVFPGIQGGPLEHVIAAKAVAFKEALEPSFKNYQEQVLKNANALAKGLESRGLRVISGGTDNHLMMVDVTSTGLTGKASEAILEEAHITCNKNMIPGDTRSPFVTSGIRLGTPAITTRGLKENHMELVAGWIHRVLINGEDKNVIAQVAQEILSLCRDYPVYKD